MEEKSIYWSSIEYAFKKENPKHLTLKGGFVYCFIQAFDAREALLKIEEDFFTQNLSIKAIEFISIYDENLEWETKAQTSDYLKLFKLARVNNEVVFDAFYEYEEE